MLLKTFCIYVFLTCLLSSALGLEGEKRKSRRVMAGQTGKEAGPNKKDKEGTYRRNGTEARGGDMGGGPKNDAACTSMGGICQRQTYICQGRYLKHRCAGSKTRQCCMPGSGAWAALCSGHHQNRVRACDSFGCGAFHSKRGGKIYKVVDVVCDDYSVVNAPFSEYCVKIFNIRPYRYVGGISRGEALGYLLPLQESFSGITSHLELQMCDLSDPSAFI